MEPLSGDRNDLKDWDDPKISSDAPYFPHCVPKWLRQQSWTQCVLWRKCRNTTASTYDNKFSRAYKNKFVWQFNIKLLEKIWWQVWCWRCRSGKEVHEHPHWYNVRNIFRTQSLCFRRSLLSMSVLPLDERAAGDPEDYMETTNA